VSLEISSNVSNEVTNTLESNPPSIADIKAGCVCLSEDDELYGLISTDVRGKMQEQRRRDPKGYDDALYHVGLNLEDMRAKFQKNKVRAELAIQSSIVQKGSWNVLQSKYEVCFDISPWKALSCFYFLP